jgi:hypothetical protein
MRPVLVVERFDAEPPIGCLDGILWEYPVLECAVVDLHAAKPASALRIVSDREICSRSAMASTAASSLAVSRTATACIGSAPDDRSLCLGRANHLGEARHERDSKARRREEPIPFRSLRPVALGSAR